MVLYSVIGLREGSTRTAGYPSAPARPAIIPASAVQMIRKTVHVFRIGHVEFVNIPHIRVSPSATVAIFAPNSFAFEAFKIPVGILSAWMARYAP